MICKHVQDPIKAWRREKLKGPAGIQESKPAIVAKAPTAIAAEKDSELGIMAEKTEMFFRRKSLQFLHWGSENKMAADPGTLQTENFLRRNSLQLFPLTQEVQSSTNGNRRISIFFCSAGTVAEKLANKLHGWLKSLVKDSSDLRLCSRSEPLSKVSASDLTADNILLLVVSSTGQGEIPPNGLGLLKVCEDILSRRLANQNHDFRFAVFGNGDSRYSATYNGAAMKINDHLTQVGGYPLVAGVFQADTAVDPLPLSILRSWLDKLQPSIVDQPIESLATAVVKSSIDDKHTAVFVKVTPIIELRQKYEDYHDRLISTHGEASMIGGSQGTHKDRSLLLTVDIDNDYFEEMSCIQILPLNAPGKVNQALRSLCVKSSDLVDLGLGWNNPTYLTFLTNYVDLEVPFSDGESLEAVELSCHKGLTRAFLSQLSVQKVLERLHSSLVQMSDRQRCEFIHDLCQDMPLLHTRTYSIASSWHYSSSCDRVNPRTGRQVDIMVKVFPRGRFSHTFVKDSLYRKASLRYRIVDSPSGSILRKNHLRSFIVVATGAGFGPVRCLLQWRISTIRDALAMGQPLPSQGSKISLFLGLKLPDLQLIVDVLNEAMSLNLIDMLDIVFSNPAKRRVYHSLRRSPRHLRKKLFQQEGMAFICTNQVAAKATKSTFSDILGGPVGEMLRERYVEEVF